jgi:hypothetical protein
MVLVADEDDGSGFPGKFKGFEVDLGDQRTSGVNHFQRTRLSLVADSGGNSVGTEDQNGTVGNFVDGFDENGATATELFDHIGVMDDFVMDVNGVPVGL